MVVCSRCSGLYAGAALGLWSPWWLQPDHISKLLRVGIVILILQLSAQQIIGISHIQRIVSGLLLGFAMSSLVSSAFKASSAKAELSTPKNDCFEQHRRHI